MNFDEFKATVIEKASVRYPAMDVSVREVMKNNGLILNGFTMCPKEFSGHSNVSKC